MTLANIPLSELRQCLRRAGLFLHMGPFIVHLRSNLSDLPPLLQQLYSEYVVAEDNSFADFHITLYRLAGLRRWWRPQVQLRVDNETPFSPFPLDTALPFLEWGLNWCVGHRAHQYLMLHAGVLEKNGSAMLFPAWPGSGKSTLCAALSHRNWRLLSDEFALVRPADFALIPFPRLIALKNESIGVIRAFAPNAVVGPNYPKTRKGTVAHMRPPGKSVALSEITAQACWIVFPHYEAGATLRLKSISKERAFLKLSGNSFNYELIGLRGFEMVSRLIESCDCHLLRYSNLEEAVTQLDCLVAQQT
jgi:HprK-related kinase A